MNKVWDLLSDDNIILKEQGLSKFKPRLAVLNVMQENSGCHMSADEIYQYLLDHEHPMSISTVYRVLSQLEKVGIVKKQNFSTERAKCFYELHDHQHHDHMVCIECRSIHEFIDLEIETRQIEIAKNFGFELTDHKLNLYGICALCSKTQVNQH